MKFMRCEADGLHCQKGKEVGLWYAEMLHTFQVDVVFVRYSQQVISLIRFNGFN